MERIKITKELRRLETNMTVRYLIAISLVAVLSIAAFMTMNSVIKGVDENEYIENMSSKQLMLSQHIALDASRIYRAASNNINSKSIQIMGQRLIKSVDEMAQANTMLSQGVLEDGSKMKLSPEIYEMYFGKMNLKYRVQQYLALVRLVVLLPDQLQKGVIVEDIDWRAEGLLVDMTAVVHQFQAEGAIRIQSIKDTKLALLGLTLLILLLEVLFIFRPMVSHIIRLSRLKAEALDELEDLVAVRTQHLQEANKQLDRLAHHDALTGLRNRLNLEADIERVIQTSAKHDTEYALLMLDLDWFKRINDQYGHDAGDKVLQDAADILRNCVREGDHVYRAGGEEFVVLLNRISYENAVLKAEQIRSAIENHPFIYKRNEIRKTLSGGFFHSKFFDVYDVKSVLKLADTALYQAKHEGRNRIVEVEPKVNSNKVV